MSAPVSTRYTQGGAQQGYGGMDPFVAGLASSMIKPNLDNALHRGQAFMQTNFGFLSSSALHYHFNINGEYGMFGWVG